MRESLVSALERDERESTRAELCTLLIQNSQILFPYHAELRGFLYELIRTSAAPHSPTSVERIIQAAETVVGWCRRSVREGQPRAEAESLKYSKLILGHLMDLVQGSVAQHATNPASTEPETLLTSVLTVVRTIFQLHPVAVLDPPDEVRDGTAVPREGSPSLRLF